MILNSNYFYSISAKKRNSHGHFKCIKKHKIMSRSCCLSAIMMLSYYFMLNSINIPKYKSKCKSKQMQKCTNTLALVSLFYDNFPSPAPSTHSPWEIWTKNCFNLYKRGYSRYRTLFPYKPDPISDFFRQTFNVKNPDLGLF
jgi:hypothetical protein